MPSPDGRIRCIYRKSVRRSGYSSRESDQAVPGKRSGDRRPMHESDARVRILNCQSMRRSRYSSREGIKRLLIDSEQAASKARRATSVFSGLGKYPGRTQAVRYRCCAERKLGTDNDVLQPYLMWKMGPQGWRRDGVTKGWGPGMGSGLVIEHF